MYVLSIDQGTSSTRAIIFDKNGRKIASHQLEHQQYYPQEGYVEHDPLEIFDNVLKCIKSVIKESKLTSKDIKSIGITNQRETTVVWNKNTGKPYYNAIVWNDLRTTELCNNIINENGIDVLRPIVGLPISPYFSGTKLLWLLNNVKNLKEEANNGNALFGTIDCYLIWKLTNGKSHVTDLTNPSRTLLMNINTLKYDDKCLKILGNNIIPKSMLPEIKQFTSGEFGYVSNNVIAELKDVLIGGVLGDQQAALFGQTCFDIGEAKNTYGTGAFLLMNTGKKPMKSNNGLLTTMAYKLSENDDAIYALEGSVAYCGSLMQWLRDNMNLYNDVIETENIAKSVNDNGGVYFVPAFAGLHAPYWDSSARGLIVGMTAYNNKAHIVRAALEAAAYQVSEVLLAMNHDSNVILKSLKVDGGMTKNSLVMQFQSDLLNVPILCPANAETTALGAAFAAGLAKKCVWKSLDEIKQTWNPSAQWTPNMEDETRKHYLKMWKKAVSRSRKWNHDNDNNIDDNESGSNGFNLYSYVTGIAVGSLVTVIACKMLCKLRK